MLSHVLIWDISSWLIFFKYTYHGQPFINLLYGFTGLCTGQIYFIVNDADLEDVEDTKKLFIKFYGEWCCIRVYKNNRN